jgi:hypothetical protein
LLEKIVIRRDFIKNTALAGSLAALPLLASGTNAGTAGSSVAPAVFGSRKVNFDFRTYRDTVSACPVYSITPDDGYYLHTFYDICPWSPSQRYFVCTKFPFQDREPDHRDEAQICVIDMKDRTLTEVYSTAAWGFQLGSNVQWGGTDRHLYFNDKVDGEGVCVRLDLETGKAEPLAGPMYHIAPDESAIVSFPLDLINQTQAGYGYAVDPARIRKMKPGAAENEGRPRPTRFFRTVTRSDSRAGPFTSSTPNSTRKERRSCKCSAAFYRTQGASLELVAQASSSRH